MDKKHKRIFFDDIDSIDAKRNRQNKVFQQYHDDIMLDDLEDSDNPELISEIKHLLRY